MELGNSRNLTEGAIWKQLLLFFFPVLLGSFFQQLYNTADAVIVGQYAGKQALAAVDATAGFTRLFLSMFAGISSGATILLSQYFGAGKHKDISNLVHTAFAFAFAGGVVLSAIGYIMSPFILRLINVPDDIFAQANEYISIYFLGMVFSLAYNMGSGILRAVGDSKSPFYYLVVSSLVNIGLDVLFVRNFNMGVAGAAYATVISQLISCILVVRALMRVEASYQLRLPKIRFHKDVTVSILRIGLPIAVQACMYPISNIFINSSINTFQTDAIAAWAICGKMDLVVWMIIESFTITISTFVAQNYGANKIDRLHKGVRLGLIMESLSIVFFSVIIMVWAKPIAAFFLKDDAVIDLAAYIVRFLAPFYVTFVFGDYLGGVIRGTGETFMPMLLTIIFTCAMRILWVVAAVPFHPTMLMVAMSYPVTWSATSIAFMIYYRHYMKKKLKVFEPEMGVDTLPEGTE